MRKQDDSNEEKLVDKGGDKTNATLSMNMESTAHTIENGLKQGYSNRGRDLRVDNQYNTLDPDNGGFRSEL